MQIDLADKEQRTALRAASWSGHEDILKALILAGADVNSVDKQGRTSLIAASYSKFHYFVIFSYFYNKSKFYNCSGALRNRRNSFGKRC